MIQGSPQTTMQSKKIERKSLLDTRNDIVVFFNMLMTFLNEEVSKGERTQKRKKRYCIGTYTGT